MKNFIISIPNSHKWIKLVPYLEKKGFKVVYIFSRGLRKKMFTKYQDKLVDSFDYTNDTLKEVYLSNPKLTLEELTYFSAFETTAIKLIERDWKKKNLTSEMKIIIFYTLYFRIKESIKKNEISHIIFTETPHQISTYVLYLASKFLNLKTLVLIPTALKPLYIITDDIFNQMTFENKQSTQNSLISSIVNEYINNTRMNFSNSIPNDFRDQKDKKNLFKWVEIQFKTILYKLKLAGKKITIQKIYQHAKYVVVSEYKIKKLKKSYQKLSKIPDLSNKYIFFPLHFQPERTTLPEGGFFERQFVLIKYILGYLPKNYFLYIKEHPAQFYRRDGLNGKSIFFYKQLSKHEQIHLIKSDYNQLELIDESRGVITVNGSSNLEAYVRNKYTINFGYPWYRNEKKMLNIHRKGDFEKFINDIQKDNNPNNSIENLQNYLFLGFEKTIDFDQPDEEYILSSIFDLLS